MEKKYCLPIALQIVLDDVGWFEGRDMRCAEGPSRTGIPRKHSHLDYEAIEAIGKEIGMKINCPFVIGEWDKKNRLRGMPHATQNEQGWNRAAEIDYAEAERCLDIINKAEHFELAFHGLMHGYWENGISVADSEFSRPRSLDYKTKYAPAAWFEPVDSDYFESHIDTFFKIYEDWGFSQKIRAFTSPSGVYGNVDENRHLVHLMKKYGMNYWSNSWGAVKSAHEVIDGVIFSNKAYTHSSLHWAAFGVDAEFIADYSFEENNGIDVPERAILGFHWPNMLYFNPERNLEGVKAWGRYMRRQAEIFGVMLSKDTAFAASQGVYRRYASVEETKDGLAIDLTAVDGAGVSPLLYNDFYISIEKGISPKIKKGGTISLYEEHKDFNNYKIERNGEKTVLLTL